MSSSGCQALYDIEGSFQDTSDDSGPEVLLKSRDMERGLGHHMNVAAAGFVTLAACAMVATISFSTTNSRVSVAGPKPATTEKLTARALLESDVLADLATDQLMDLGHKVLDFSKWDEVRALVGQGFKNVSVGIRQQDSETFERLNQLQLTHEQAHAVLRVLVRMGDPKVQSIGMDVASALMQGGREGKVAAKRLLMQKLHPRLQEISKLREQIFPAVLRGVDQSEQGDMVLDPDNLYVIKTFPNKWNIQLEVSRESIATRRRLIEKPLLRTEEAFGVVGAVMEQARILLDQFNAIEKMFGKKSSIPPIASSAVGGVDFVTNLITCMIDGFEGTNPQLLLVCPMRFASAATDVMLAMRAFMSGLRNTPTTVSAFHGSPGGVGSTNAPLYSSEPWSRTTPGFPGAGTWPVVKPTTTTAAANTFTTKTTIQHSFWPW